jgi:predicted anti-sigma-YlaC factor YlaD
VQVLAQGPPPPGCPSTGCEAARKHAHDLLDGSLADVDRAAVQAHLDDCPCCPAALQAVTGVLSALASAEQHHQPIPASIRVHLQELVQSVSAGS